MKPGDSSKHLTSVESQPDLSALMRRIFEIRAGTPWERAVIVALTGIDGSGKGFVARALVRGLEAAGARVALLNVDGWLNLPHRRFCRENPASHFYAHAIRFDELFEQLVRPLRDHRSIQLVAACAGETAHEFRPQLYAFDDVDVVVVEGIYLLKREFHQFYDLSVWIDCSFETALERAVARAQEALPPAATVAAYESIYFPAQRIHFQRDDPRGFADVVLHNDVSERRPAGLESRGVGV